MGDIPDLTDQQWQEIAERLTLYASCKLARKSWRGMRVKKGQSVVKGTEAGDLAAEAILSVLEGTRTWNLKVDPTFYEFLQGIIDSKVSALVQSAENRKTRTPSPLPATGEPAGPDDSASTIPTPATLVEDAEWKEKFQAAVAKEVGEDSIALGLFECFYAGITDRAEIAETLSVSIEDIYNAQKRLKKRVATVMKRFEQGTKP